MFLRGQKVSNISKNIKEYRLREGLKQKEFAALLEMHEQNYSKLERGVYTPSMEKLLDICAILCITPNDLLLEGRTFDDYKQQVFEQLDASVIDVINTMKIVEQKRSKALLAKQQGDQKAERLALDDIIQMFAWKNEHFWMIADFLYHKKIDELLHKASSKLEKELMDKMKQEL